MKNKTEIALNNSASCSNNKNILSCKNNEIGQVKFTCSKGTVKNLYLQNHFLKGMV